MRWTWWDALAVAGVAVVAAGTACIYWPASLILLGVGATVVGVVGDAQRKRAEQSKQEQEGRFHDR